MKTGSRSVVALGGPLLVGVAKCGEIGRASWVLIITLLLPGSIAAGKSPHPSANETASTFKLQCSSCHGRNGAGDTSVGKTLKAADLRSPQVQKQSDAQLAQVIAEGRKNMPSFSNSLAQDQIRALVAYIRKLAKSHK